MPVLNSTVDDPVPTHPGDTDVALVYAVGRYVVEQIARWRDLTTADRERRVVRVRWRDPGTG